MWPKERQDRRPRWRPSRWPRAPEPWSDSPPSLLSSLLAAGLYAIMSYGLAVIYGVMRIINLAHAGLMMLAAYVDPDAQHPLRSRPFPVWWWWRRSSSCSGWSLYVTLIRRLPRGGSAPSMQSLAVALRRVARAAEPGLRHLGWGHPVHPHPVHHGVRPAPRRALRRAAAAGLRGEPPVPGGAQPRAPAHLPREGHPRGHPEPRRGDALGRERGPHRRGGLRLGTAFAAIAGACSARSTPSLRTSAGAFSSRPSASSCSGAWRASPEWPWARWCWPSSRTSPSAYTSIPVSFQDAISFTLLVVVLVAAPGGLPGLWRLLDRRVVAR